ncbi:MAG: MFS transporter [Pigmentiphaga sp.]|uniref:MFS transporter n=1 Tax=Pigmentiphaga sp. TaxID=1977564 RepID=UPI0029BE67F7|nr:MFS transporter [Pigmentiphaga sp.]MDX3905483.1 MFS transporter [Pigmentiphaga sp.]
MTATSSSSSSPSGLQLLPLVAIVFSGFLAVGLPLPAMPLHVNGVLGYSPLVVGWVIGLQPLATILTRKFAGSYVDRHGPKQAVLVGLPMAAVAGLLYVVSALLTPSSLSLAILVLGRILMGPAESLFLTGTMTWGIGRVGPHRTGLVMSWQGIAMFAALGLGAPAGVAIMQAMDFLAVGLATIAFPLAGLAVAACVPPVPVPGGSRPQASFLRVIGLIWRQGAALSLASAPFAVLTAFVVLYFANRGWHGAGLAMTGFAAGYILVRLFFGRLPDQLGGRRVAAVSLVIEALGQLLLWMAPTPAFALAGATLTGVGFSLVFPSMGVEAMRRVPPESRGVAVGGFLAFVDVTSAVTGPLAGLLIGAYGYPAAFLAGLVACLVSFAAVVFGLGPVYSRTRETS